MGCFGNQQGVSTRLATCHVLHASNVFYIQHTGTDCAAAKQLGVCLQAHELTAEALSTASAEAPCDLFAQPLVSMAWARSHVLTDDAPVCQGPCSVQTSQLQHSCSCAAV